MLFTGAPPTPAATTSSAIPITSPTPTAWHMATPRHDSNPGALPTPSRMRRATERAWTTLAAMQRVSDPVGLATPAPDFPDSPARAPSKVDPYAGSRTAWGPDTSVGSQDELESIASFSDVSERPPMPTLGEQQQRSDPAPPHATFSDHPLSVGVQQVEEGRYTPTPTMTILDSRSGVTGTERAQDQDARDHDHDPGPRLETVETTDHKHHRHVMSQHTCMLIPLYP